MEIDTHAHLFDGCKVKKKARRGGKKLTPVNRRTKNDETIKQSFNHLK